MDAGDSLELQCAFHGDRVVAATAEEQRVLFVGKALGPDFDLEFEAENLVDRDQQVAQLGGEGPSPACGRGAKLFT